MVPAGAVLDAAQAQGFDFISGVGCNFLAALRDEALARVPSVRFMTTAMAGESMEVAAGAALGGRSPIVLCSSTAIGNALTPMTSLIETYRIPVLMLIGWRGQPGDGDASHHEPMGRRIESLLDTFDIRSRRFPSDPAELGAAFAAARMCIDRNGLSYAMLVARDTIGNGRRPEAPRRPSAAGAWHDLRRHEAAPSRRLLLEAFVERVVPSVAVIAPTGHCGRDLFEIDDREQNFYMPGSSGCGPGVGLGVAIATTRRVVAFDGDGSAVRRLGCLATIGRERPGNLIHVLFDNGRSGGIDFPAVSLACGYAGAYACDDVVGFRTAVEKALKRPGPSLIHAKIRAEEGRPAPRPSITPAEVAQRFTAFLTRRVTA